MLRKGDKHGAQKVIEKIYDLIEANKRYILGILDAVEKSGEYGICIEDTSKKGSAEIMSIEELCQPILLGDHERRYFIEFRNMLLDYFNKDGCS